MTSACGGFPIHVNSRWQVWHLFSRLSRKILAGLYHAQEHGVAVHHAIQPIGGLPMKKMLGILLTTAAITVAANSVALAKDKTIGVSWSNFQEERWKTDEAAMKAAIEANGDTYISSDAQASAAKQLTDVESLIAQGADALVILSVYFGRCWRRR